MDKDQLKELKKRLKPVLKKYDLDDKLGQVVDLIHTYSKHPPDNAPSIRDIDNALETLGNKVASKKNILKTALTDQWFDYTSHTHGIDKTYYDETDYDETDIPDDSQWLHSIREIVETLHDLENQIAFARHLRPAKQGSPPGRGIAGAFYLNVKNMLQDIDCSMVVIQIADVFLNLSPPSDESLRLTLKDIGESNVVPKHPKTKEPILTKEALEAVPGHLLSAIKLKPETWSIESTEPWHKGLLERAQELKNQRLSIKAIAKELNVSASRIQRMALKIKE